MDLADFPRLTVLNLVHTSVTGDVRDICEYDFPVLESLALPVTVHGGMCYQFQNISDVPSFMHTIHILLQRIPTPFREIWLLRAFVWLLSRQSPDWYADGIGHPPPFNLQLIRAGSRLGWRWCTWDGGHLCEINWLDPEPSSECDDYEAYIEALQRIEGELNTDFYRGYHEPPTEMEYRRLCEGLSKEIRDSSQNQHVRICEMHSSYGLFRKLVNRIPSSNVIRAVHLLYFTILYFLSNSNLFLMAVITAAAEAFVSLSLQRRVQVQEDVPISLFIFCWKEGYEQG